MFKSLISNALSSVGLGSTPTRFQFELGEKQDTRNVYSRVDFVWTIYDGFAKGDSKNAVSVFVLDKKKASSIEISRAQNEVLRLKTVRHPKILKFLDSAETDGNIFLAVERVTPFLVYLEDNPEISSSDNSYAISELIEACQFVKRKLN